MELADLLWIQKVYFKIKNVLICRILWVWWMAIM